MIDRKHIIQTWMDACLHLHDKSFEISISFNWTYDISVLYGYQKYGFGSISW
jgi:hypothetical protein